MAPNLLASPPLLLSPGIADLKSTSAVSQVTGVTGPASLLSFAAAAAVPLRKRR